MGWYYGFKPYVSVATRRAKAAKEMAKLAKKGQTVTPVKLDGKKIATTFWGKAWCENLESYSDFANRLPRGRAYVRNGSVVDLQLEAGRVSAMVSGSELYKVKIDITPLASKIWSFLKRECGGKIGSLVELLQGRLSQSVMELVTRHDGGLFPKPAEIEMHCSCPDYAGMCKHVAAVMYGVGARLDQQPELLFKLRKVDHIELIDAAGTASINTKATSQQTIAAGDLADVFGIDIDIDAPIIPAVGAVAEIASSNTKSKIPKRVARSRMIAKSSSADDSRPLSAPATDASPRRRKTDPERPPTTGAVRRAIKPRRRQTQAEKIGG